MEQHEKNWILSVACKNWNLNKIKEALSSWADINFFDFVYFWTPLTKALDYWHKNVITFIINHPNFSSSKNKDYYDALKFIS